MKRNTRPVPLYVFLLFVVCLALLFGTGVMNYWNLQKLKQNTDWMERSWRVSDHLKNVNLLIIDAEANLRGYYLTGNAVFLRPWQATRKNLATEFATLEMLFAENPVQQKNLLQLQALTDRKIQRLQEHNGRFEKSGLTAMIDAAKFGDGSETMDEIRLLDTIMEREESATLANARNQFYRDFHRLFWIGNLMNGLAILILLLFFRLIHTSFAKRKVVENALHLANANLETKVLARTEQLSVLSRHLLKVTEEEKAKLARELHDQMGANLAVIGMELSMTIQAIKKQDAGIAAQLMKTKDGLLEVVDLKRRIVESLRPSMLDHLGLAATIKNHYEEVARRAALSLDMEIAEDIDHLDPELAIALFRIAQESLTNVIKYARASRVGIVLQYRPSHLRLQITDDGVGIAGDVFKASTTHGLLGMRERALLAGGTLTVSRGSTGRGTVIEVSIPLLNAGPASESATVV